MSGLSPCGVSCVCAGAGAGDVRAAHLLPLHRTTPTAGAHCRGARCAVDLPQPPRAPGQRPGAQPSPSTAAATSEIVYSHADLCCHFSGTDDCWALCSKGTHRCQSVFADTLTQYQLFGGSLDKTDSIDAWSPLDRALAVRPARAVSSCAGASDKEPQVSACGGDCLEHGILMSCV